jgi:hypothetical protein
MQYRRITEGLNDRGQLIASDKDVFEYVKNHDKDHYLSTFKYNEEQKNQFQETGTVAGVTDVTTDKLWFDFDSEFEPEEAQQSTIALLTRLEKLGVSSKDAIITFSGNKGMGVELNLNQTLSPKQVKSVCFELAKDLKHFDVKMYNSSRILRLYGTKHQKTGLYKIPLSFTQLKELSIDQIMDLAKNPPQFNEAEFHWNRVDLPESLQTKQTKDTKEVTKEDIEVSTYLDFSMKPKFLTNCRWSIQNGHFSAGERSTALLCLGSTYKNLGFDLEHVYRLLKGTAELQSRIHSSDRFSDEEIYNNIVMQVFGPSWNNGQYSCREKDNWLNLYCNDLDHPCNHKAEDDMSPKTFISLEPDFKDYVKNIDKNTIKTGLVTLDKHVFLSTGANVGVIAPPGAGKTSLAFELLENTSRAGIHSVFGGLDMAKNRTFEKLLYRVTGLDRKELYEIWQNGKEGPIMEQVQERFKNVHFFKKSAPTVQDFSEYVQKVQDKTGEKVKLVVGDYFERFNSDIGDDTAASKAVAGQLQDMVDNLDICNITLYQPNKHALAGGPDQPIYDYTKIKGSSFVYQSLRIILSMWRPFYNPKDFSNDKYLQMAILKNDLGELNEFSFNWQGKKGLITDMEDFQREEFEALMREKAAKNPDKGSLNF